MAVDKVLPVAITADNKDAGCPDFVVNQVTGSSYAYYSEGSGSVYSNHQLTPELPASWTVTQEENYKYLAGSATFTVAVEKVAEETEPVLYYDQEFTRLYTGTEICTSDNTLTLYWDAKNVAKELIFEGKKSSGASTLTITPEQYVNGDWSSKDGWGVKGSLGTSYKIFDNKIVDAEATAVRFSDDGSLYKGYVRNVQIKYLGSVTSDGVAITTQIDAEGEGTLAVNYAIVNGGALKLHCDNPKFKFTDERLSANESSLEIGGSDGNTDVLNIPVYYLSDVEENVEATVLIYNDVYRVEAKITASVTKITPVITLENVALTYGEAPKAIEATVDQEVTILYEVTEGTDVVEYKDGKLKALKAGNAKVRAYTEGTTKFNASEKIVDVTVAKATPEVSTNPTADTIKLGQSLSDSELHNGEASVEGTFAWEDDSIEPTSVGLLKYNVVFTPTDTKNYEQVVVEVDIYVEDKATGCEELQTGVKAVKVIRNGQVLILREGKIYNLSGQVVE